MKLNYVHMCMFTLIGLYLQNISKINLYENLLHPMLIYAEFQYVVFFHRIYSDRSLKEFCTEKQLHALHFVVANKPRQTPLFCKNCDF